MGVNVIANPDFEVNTDGWSAIGGTTMARVTSTFYTGIACLEVNTSTDFLGVVCNNNTPGDHQNETWRLSAWVKAKTAGDVGLGVTCLLICNNGGQAEGTDNNLLSDSVWQQIQVTLPITEFTANLRADFRAATSSATGFYLDDVVLEEVPIPTAGDNVPHLIAGRGASW